MNDAGHANYIGPFLGWLANAAVWTLGGMSPLAAAGALAVLWWTVERALTERAKRAMLTDLHAEARPSGFGARLKQAIKTEPGDLR